MTKGRIVSFLGFVSFFTIMVILLNSATVRRFIKSTQSNLGNGIPRTITVYDYEGKEIKSWHGKFDVTQSNTGLIFDDQYGKRVVITNGIIINEEDRK